MFVSQLNATFQPLVNISGNTASVIQPNVSVFAGDPAINVRLPPNRIIMSLLVVGLFPN